MTACLGGVRKEEKDLMLRDPGGQVIFLQSWWTASFRQAAQGLNRHFREAPRILAVPTVDGPLGTFRRHYSKDGFKDHEAYPPNAQVTVRFCLPVSLSVADFAALLNFVGDYVGISPYGHRDGFGRFKVESVESAAKSGG